MEAHGGEAGHLDRKVRDQAPDVYALTGYVYTTNAVKHRAELCRNGEASQRSGEILAVSDTPPDDADIRPGPLKRVPQKPGFAEINAIP